MVPAHKLLHIQRQYLKDGSDNIYTEDHTFKSDYSLAALTWTDAYWYHNRDNIGFDLPVIPLNATINSASLSMYAKPEQYEMFTSHGAHFRWYTDSVYGIFDRFNDIVIPGQSTWAVLPSADSSHRLSLDPVYLDNGSSYFADPDSTKWYIYSDEYMGGDCTGLVRDMYTEAYNNNRNFGLQFKLSEEDTGVYKALIFWGIGDNVPTGKEPYLEVNYTAARSDVFTSFMNKALQTHLTASQVAAIYARCDVYGGTITPGENVLLCGKTEASPTYTIEEVYDPPCSDSSTLANNAAEEIYTVYKDSLDQSFNQKYTAKCLGAASIESFVVEHKVSEYHYTLYYYDQAGNLVKTVAPEGVRPIRDKDSLKQVVQSRKGGQKYVPAHVMPTLYRYNSLNQVVSQKTPDAGKTTNWYDRLGRLAVSRNAKQLAESKYSYTLYDALGRIIEVGQKYQTTAMTGAISRDTAALAGWIYYNDGANHYPAEMVTQTVYDIPGVDATACPTALRFTQKSYTLRNRVSYTRYYEKPSYYYDAGAARYYISGATYTTGIDYSYDIHGNVDSMRNLYNAITYSPITYHGYNSCKTIAYKYDLISGKVNEVHYNPGENDEFYHRYEYDAENRLTDVYTTDTKAFIGRQGLEEHEAKYLYYQHGPLARIQAGQQIVQGVDYAYTLQGWLKGINSTAVSGTYDMGGDGTGANVSNGADGYSYTLYYFNGDYGPINYNQRPFAEPQSYFPSGEYRPLYNGNISSAAHSIPARFYTQLYNYRYDQLNRLKAMDMYRGLITSTNLWSSLALQTLYKERYSYDANGNITYALRNGNLSANPLMDSLTYFYKTGTNQLDYIRDKNNGSTAHSSNYGATADIKDQAAANYVYNPIGELNYDRISSIDSVKWNVYGKMQHIYKHSSAYGTEATGLHYHYDPSGNRTGMAVLYDPSSSYNVYTWYVRDAQGNVMAVYKASGANLATIALKLKEHYIYGSSRLGVINRDMDVDQPRLAADNGNANLGTAYLATFTRGDKLFEFTNHLGNVLFTATDAKVPKAQTGTPSLIESYSVNMVTAVDYTPFGMIMQGMNYNSAAASKYRYGFNGKEWENGQKGSGDQIDYGERMYDNRAGRFLSVDPLTRDYPWYSPYQFAGNKPIQFTDLDGLEENSTSTYVKIRVPVLPLMNKDKILPVPKAYYFQNDTRTLEQRQQALSDAQYKQRLNSMYNSAEGWSFRFFVGIGQASTVVIPEAAAAKELGQAAIEGDAQKLLQAAVTYGQSAKVRILNNTYQTLTRSNSQANKSLATLGEFDNEQALKTFNIVKSGTLPGSQGAYLGGSRLTDGQMQSLSDLYKVEFAQVYTAGTGKNGGGGFYTLYSGTRNRIDIPLSANSFLINHTHPGGTRSPSILDVNYLKKVRELGSPQRSSSIIPSGGKTLKFNENTPANGTE